MIVLEERTWWIQGRNIIHDISREVLKSTWLSQDQDNMQDVEKRERPAMSLLPSAKRWQRKKIMEVSRGRRYAKGRCGLILLLLLSSIFFVVSVNFFFLKDCLFHCNNWRHTRSTSKVGIIPGGLGIMRWLGRSSLTHVVQWIKIQVGTRHVINWGIVARLHGETHGVASHAHGRRGSRWWWAAVVWTELQSLHRLYG